MIQQILELFVGSFVGQARNQSFGLISIVASQTSELSYFKRVQISIIRALQQLLNSADGLLVSETSKCP